MQVLIIGFVWPEPNSSAAGSRMMQLISLFLEQKMTVTFASTAAKTVYMVDLEALGVATTIIELNSSSFDTYVKELNPEIVVFDRFMVEEQFGWRVASQCPEALRILDTEDLHCLRKTRQEAFKKGVKFNEEMLLSSEMAKRELASIYRSDVTLIISTYEMQLLQETFGIKKELLCYLPLLLEQSSLKDLEGLPSFSDRTHFLSIGNFRHEPNWNMVLYLKETIWPLIRKELPNAELHVYGAYPSGKVTQLHNEKQGFLIKGWAEDAAIVMQQSRVCLAPIRFGAGIKGKLIDAMQNNTPHVTTNVGAEGMWAEELWGGYIEDNPESFAKKAVALYTDKAVWKEKQQEGIKLLNTKYLRRHYQEQYIDYIVELKEKLASHRQANFIGSMLQHHSMQSTKYLSKWIEEKGKRS